MDENSEYDNEERIANLNISFNSDDLHCIELIAVNPVLNIDRELSSRGEIEKLTGNGSVNTSNEFPNLSLEE